jgi:hypothetical protein
MAETEIALDPGIEPDGRERARRGDRLDRIEDERPQKIGREIPAWSIAPSGCVPSNASTGQRRITPVAQSLQA